MLSEVEASAVALQDANSRAPHVPILPLPLRKGPPAIVHSDFLLQIITAIRRTMEGMKKRQNAGRTFRRERK